ncbi:MAG: 2OG-Fe(II) oxygenase [Acidobacteriota bacterium]
MTRSPWEEGRRGTGYLKRRLFRWRLGRLGSDAYLLKYPEGSSVPPHRDPVDGGSHYRLNIELRRAARGGDFRCDTTIVRLPRIALFRPDRHEHSVSRVEEGTRWVFSVGVALFSGAAA